MGKQRRAPTLEKSGHKERAPSMKAEKASAEERRGELGHGGRRSEGEERAQPQRRKMTVRSCDAPGF
jgi:hypothetical protein